MAPETLRDRAMDAGLRNGFAREQTGYLRLVGENADTNSRQLFFLGHTGMN